MYTFSSYICFFKVTETTSRLTRSCRCKSYGDKESRTGILFFFKCIYFSRFQELSLLLSVLSLLIWNLLLIFQERKYRNSTVFWDGNNWLSLKLSLSFVFAKSYAYFFINPVIFMQSFINAKNNNPNWKFRPIYFWPG